MLIFAHVLVWVEPGVSPTGPCVKGFVTNMWHYWKVVQFCELCLVEKNEFILDKYFNEFLRLWLSSFYFASWLPWGEQVFLTAGCHYFVPCHSRPTAVGPRDHRLNTLMISQNKPFPLFIVILEGICYGNGNLINM